VFIQVIQGKVADAAGLLAVPGAVLVVDWPSRDVPEGLARAGWKVVVRNGPGPQDYATHELEGDSVVVRPLGRPPVGVDLVYAHRPLAELPGIVETALALGARGVWVQSGLAEGGGKDSRGCWMPEEEADRARALVESSGLVFVSGHYIGDALGRRR